MRERIAAILEMALRRTGVTPKKDRGFNWACYCPVCCELRALLDE